MQILIGPHRFRLDATRSFDPTRMFPPGTVLSLPTQPLEAVPSHRILARSIHLEKNGGSSGCSSSSSDSSSSDDDRPDDAVAAGFRGQQRRVLTRGFDSTVRCVSIVDVFHPKMNLEKQEACLALPLQFFALSNAAPDHFLQRPAVDRENELRVLRRASFLAHAVSQQITHPHSRHRKTSKSSSDAVVVTMPAASSSTATTSSGNKPKIAETDPCAKRQASSVKTACEGSVIAETLSRRCALQEIPVSVLVAALRVPQLRDHAERRREREEADERHAKRAAKKQNHEIDASSQISFVPEFKEPSSARVRWITVERHWRRDGRRFMLNVVSRFYERRVVVAAVDSNGGGGARVESRWVLESADLEESNGQALDAAMLDAQIWGTDLVHNAEKLLKSSNARERDFGKFLLETFADGDEDEVNSQNEDDDDEEDGSSNEE